MLRNLQCACVSLLLVATCMPSSRADEKAAETVALEGRVVGPDDGPVVGASVYLAVGDTWATLTRGYAESRVAPTLLGVSGVDGRFRVEAPRRDVLAPNSVLPAAVLVAVGPNGSTFGVDWEPVYLFAEAEPAPGAGHAGESGAPERPPAPRLRLSKDDIPIEGRLVTDEGKPVAGATVRVANIQQVRDEDLTAYLEAARRDNPRDYDEARIRSVTKTFFGEIGRREGFGELISATTDAEGRFILHGCGRHRVAWLIIDGPGIASERVLVRSQEGAMLAVRDGQAVFRFYPARFEHNVVKSVPLEGRVVDADSGGPVASVVIENSYFQIAHVPGPGVRTFHRGVVAAVTDAAGRYRLTGLPLGATAELLASAQDSPHMPSHRSVELQSGAVPAPPDWRLKRGVWVSGRVFNARSCGPVWCNMHYFAFRDNPHLPMVADFSGVLADPTTSTYVTDIDGRYRIPGLPGRGIVSARVIDGAVHDRYPTAAGAERFEGARGTGIWTTYDTAPGECRPVMFHGVREVEPTQADLLGQDFPLDPSVTLTGRILDPESRPLKDFKYAGANDFDFFMLPVQGDEFEVRDYQPSVPRRLIFWHEGRRMAGTILLEGERRGPVEVELAPQGAITGRVVDDRGAPVPGIILEAAPLSPPRSPADVCALPEHSYKTDDEGRFRVDGVAPGMKYNLVTTPPDGALRQVVFDAVADSGEVTDLGDLRLLPLRISQE